MLSGPVRCLCSGTMLQESVRTLSTRSGIQKPRTLCTAGAQTQILPMTVTGASGTSTAMTISICRLCTARFVDMDMSDVNREMLTHCMESKTACHQKWMIIRLRPRTILVCSSSWAITLSLIGGCRISLQVSVYFGLSILLAQAAHYFSCLHLQIQLE